MYSFKFVADTQNFMRNVGKMPDAMKSVTDTAKRTNDALRSIGSVSLQRPREFAKGVGTGFTEVSAQAAQTGKNISKSIAGALPVSMVQNQMQQVKSAIATAFAFTSVQKTAESAIETLAKFEAFEAVLTNVLGGNAAAGRKVMSDIAQFAASTPMQVDELTESWQRLANAGIRPSMKFMANLGDVASSQNKSMKQWVESVLDARMGEFERLKEFGVKAKVDKKTSNIKFTFKGVSKEVKNDENAIVSYLASLGEMQGVKGMMDVISKTTGGQISNLKDQLDLLYLDIGRATKPLISNTLSGLGAGLSHLKTSLPEYLNLATAISKIGIAWLGYKAVVIGSGIISTTIDMVKNAYAGLQFATRIVWMETATLRAMSLSWAQTAFWGTIQAMKSLGGMVVQLFTVNFWQNTLRLGAISTFATMKAGAVSAWQGLMRLPAAILLSAQNMVRLGATSVMTMARYAISTASATFAQWSLNAALLANPIGLTIAGFAVAGAAVYGVIKHWDTIKVYLSQFAAWAWANNPFSWIGNLVSSVFPNFSSSVSGLMTSIKNSFLAGWNYIYNTFVKPVTSFFNGFMDFKIEVPTAKIEGDATTFMENGQKKSVYQEVSDLTSKKGKDKDKKGAGSHISDGLSGVRGDNKITHITNNIKSLIEKVTINVANASGISESGIKEQLTNLLLEAVNDVNYAY